MANVYNMSSHNGNQDKLNEANAIKSRMTVFLVIGLIIAVIGVGMFLSIMNQGNSYMSIPIHDGVVLSEEDYTGANNPFFAMGMIFVGMIIFANARYKRNKVKNIANMLQQGIDCENYVANSLETLPSNYYVLNNVGIKDNMGRSEIDSLVVSKNGIWIVEVKSHIGSIYGEEEDNVWDYERANGQDDEIENPLKQSYRQMKILKNIFDDKGIDVFVKYCVVFPNASAVCVNSDKVYTSLDRLKQDILLGSNKKISTNELIKILGVFGIQDDSLKCTAETVKKKPVKQKAEKTVHTQKEEIKPNTQKVQEAVFASLEEADLSRQISEQLERERNLHENEIRKACRNSKKKMHGNSKGHTKSSSYDYDDNNSLHRQMMNDDMLFDQQQLMNQQLMNQQEMDRFMQESTHISEQACQESLNFTMHDSYNAMNDSFNAMNDSSFNNDFGSFGGFGPF
ncbi:nuclease-related domain-containing protein [Holdemanella biformis]|uniref:nuclease-related domain-containing protein n=1 Tax=Holdemanella biformis TaxID=1735 RepID=UPI001C3880C4|nr:nuclease-related domain-containing protein [Holdemanella biformis]MBV4130824.1 NERD domain-containing protein [Holdemanella biformis]MBV4150578.1 NERD domain-containing protein [Holdemanella biformis]